MSGLSAPLPVLLPGLSGLSAFVESARFARLVSSLFAPLASAGSVLPVPGLSAPSAFAGSIGSTRPIFGLFAPSTSAESTLPMPGLSALFVFAPCAFSESTIFVSGLFASAAPMLESSALH